VLNLINDYLYLLPIVGIASALVFFVSLLSLPWLVALIPEDYFSSKQRKPPTWQKQHPVIRALITIVKNLLGIVLLAGGFLMLFMPGQGILTMVAGLILIDYPGKFALEKKIANSPSVLKGLNWLRAKANKPPLQ
jgi:archaellum biogenesis protein FlaJ (TadC family)